MIASYLNCSVQFIVHGMTELSSTLLIVTTHEQAHASGSRSARKHRAIVDAARDVFLRHGYTAATVDEIAALADVSKVTIYTHFSDKHSLFIAVFTDAIREAEESSQSVVHGLGESEDIGRDLRTFARRHVVLVTQPHLVRMRRTIIAEADRFPDLARAWHRAGPERGHQVLAGQLERLAQRNVLRIDDALLAAQHLNYLILSVPLNEAMFAVRDKPYGRRRLHRFADEAVRVFLAAYGTSEASS
jgi:AcrR family transcriptional regulator